MHVDGFRFDLAPVLGRTEHGFSRDSGEKTQFLMAYRVDLPASGGLAAHTATLLWVKPRLTAQASLDLRQYQVTHPAFPQETTSDQFFDDEQWESYRQLGALAGNTMRLSLR